MKPRLAKKSRMGGLLPAAEPDVPRRARLYRRGVTGAAFLLLVAMLTRPPEREQLRFSDLDTSSIPRENYEAAFTFEMVDRAATKRVADEAAEAVPDHYRIDLNRVQAQRQVLQARIESVRALRPRVAAEVLEALRASTSAEAASEVMNRAVNAFAARLKETPEWEDGPSASALALWLTPDVLSIPEREFEAPESGAPAGAPRPVIGLAPNDPAALVFTYGDLLSDLALDSQQYVLTQGVRGQLPPGDATRKVVIVRPGPDGAAQLSNEMPLSEVPDPVKAASALGLRLETAAKSAARGQQEPAEWAKLHDAALGMAAATLTDTIVYDNIYTTGAREQARKNAPPVMKEIKAGEIIQERGRRWTTQSIADMETYLGILESEEKPQRRMIGAILANAMLVALGMYALRRAVALRSWGPPEEALNHYHLALLLLCGTLVMGRVAWYFEPTGFVLPVAAAGILYAILVNTRLAVLLSFVSTMMISAQYGHDWRLLLVGMVMSIAGIFSIFRVRRRSDMAAASLTALGAGLIAVIAISLSLDSLVSETALRRVVLVAFNGWLCLMVVPGLLSPLERLFRITTDIQLLEYSDLNNELLSQLAIQVPGTHAHSQILGQLAEAAADAIGANGLKARVCAYYHDIGKMKRPEYFSENQSGYNIHDEMSPRLSARAIAAHVIQGAEMARDYHLPKPIIDGILEHHGTCLIGYFYELAKKQQKHGDIRESDFRYPGPKPQSPETAILMICDASESGVRSIKNPNEERVREFVDKIVAARAADRQFDECNLTFKQLNTIAEVIALRILTNLHTRVAYPDMRSEQKADNVIPISSGGGAE